jgi:hypothetical protein
MSDDCLVWIDMTVAGSKWERQITDCGRYTRHRNIYLSSYTISIDENGFSRKVDGPWTDGPPPFQPPRERPPWPEY